MSPSLRARCATPAHAPAAGGEIVALLLTNAVSATALAAVALAGSTPACALHSMWMVLGLG